MKKTFLCILLVFLSFNLFIFDSNTVASAEKTSADTSKARIVIDARSGKIIEEKNIDEKLPIASMVKIMTALITIEQIENNNISLDEKITISERAFSMGGSQMFLDKNTDYSVSDLLKGVVVVSANDACVALAERISGDVDSFVNLMNARAKELGMNNTVFCNCTGLPGGTQYSTARDVSIMSKELYKHDLFYNYSKIWLEDYTHPSGRITTFTNTNKLVRFYKDCDGGKTGFTNDAMFCLSARATRGNVSLISVVIGCKSSKERFSEITNAFNKIFADYKTDNLKKSGEILGVVNVKNGKVSNTNAVLENDLFISRLKSEKNPYEIVVEYDTNIVAPIVKGQIVGTAKVICEGQEVARANVVTDTEIPVATYGDNIDKVLEQW